MPVLYSDSGTAPLQTAQAGGPLLGRCCDHPGWRRSQGCRSCVCGGLCAGGGTVCERCKHTVWIDGRAEADSHGQREVRYVTSEGMLEDIAQGLPMSERKLALAVQDQSYGPMFDEKLTVAAGQTESSWAIISAQDR